MTESPGPLGRIDLRALDADDPRRVDRVTGAVLQRVAALPQRPTAVNALEAVSQYARPALAAAALSLAVAASLLVAQRRDPGDGASLAALVDWAAAAHTPTNGELLAAFAGYAR
jgi:hypothetical protein